MKFDQQAEINELIRRSIEGDPDAFLLIVREFGLPLRSFLAAQLYHLNDVDDLAQEVLITALKKLDTFEIGRDFGAWLRGIARFKLQNYFRSNRRRNSAMERFQAEVAEIIHPELEKAAAEEDQRSIEALLACIDKLPEKLKKVVRSGLDGQRAKVLAEELETTCGAIYNYHYRSNQLLRECVVRERQHSR